MACSIMSVTFYHPLLKIVIHLDDPNPRVLLGFSEERVVKLITKMLVLDSTVVIR